MIRGEKLEFLTRGNEIKTNNGERDEEIVIHQHHSLLVFIRFIHDMRE